jgi:hypothetical protein
MTRRLIIALLLLVTCELSAGEPPHVKLARSYIGTVEKGGNNRGPEVKRFLKSVGLDQGQPWCAAFVSYILTETHAVYPTKRTALARGFISKRSVKAKDVLLGRSEIDAGWLSIYGKGNTVFGHIEIVTTWDAAKRKGRSTGGNTSSGRAERDGDGVWEKGFTIQPGNYFRITHFEPVEYAPTTEGATVTATPKPSPVRPVLTPIVLPVWKLWREPWS